MKTTKKHSLISFVALLFLTVLLITPSTTQAAVMTPVSPNVPFTGQLEVAGTEHCYSFTVDKTGYFNISFKPVDVTLDTQLGWTLSLYNASTGAKIYSTDTEAAATLPAFNFKKGTRLFLKVYSKYTYLAPINQRYSINIKTVANNYWEQEENDTLSTATPIKGNTAYYGHLYHKADVDYFKYTVAKDGYFNIDFRPTDLTKDTLLGYTITAYNAANNAELFSFDATISAARQYNNFKKGTKLIFKINAVGTYSVPTLQTYSFKITEKSSNFWDKEAILNFSDPWSKYKNTATKLTLKKNYTGNLWRYDDTDLYKFTLPQSGYITLSFNPNDISSNLGGGYHIKLLSSTGASISEVDAVKTRTAKKYFLKKGSYYINVGAKWNYSATYAPVNKNYILSAKYTSYASTKASSVKAKGTKVSWKKVSDATGYEVCYSTKSNFKGAKTKTTSKNSYTLSNLKKNTTYYVRVRPYKKTLTNSKVCGSWSKTVKAKRK